jgi:hypothetical protein
VCKKKFKDNHAGARLVERYGSSPDQAWLSMDELRKLLHAGEVQYLYRETATRSLCRAKAEQGFVYFIANRKRGSIVTVLTEEQAKKLLDNIGRTLPEVQDKKEAPTVFVVQWTDTGEVLAVFKSSKVEPAMDFCSKRVGQQLTWREHNSHGRCWQAAEAPYVIAAAPLLKADEP